MKIKLDWLFTDSIENTITYCENYEILDFSIEFEHTIPQLVLSGTQEQLHKFVFEFYNNTGVSVDTGKLTEEDFWGCVVKN